MNFSIIAALANNNVIGRRNSIPWFLPDDMIWFKYHTISKIVIMGYKTFESIGNKPLAKRFNVVLSSKGIINRQKIANLAFVKTVEEALWKANNICSNSEIMIIGGGEVYDAFFFRVNRLYLTCIDISIQGDTFFPSYDKEEWKLIFNKNGVFNCASYVYCFNIFDRL